MTDTNEPQDDSQSSPPPLPSVAAATAAPAEDKQSIDLSRVAPLAVNHDQDTASQSLADALKTSFVVLKVAMVLLVIAYLASGFVRIGQQEAGVKIFLGEAKGTLTPGGHLTLPFPFESVLRVKTTPQEATVGDAFFYANENKATIEDLKFRIADLAPEKDGSLIAADGGIVHARARVLYTVDDPETFIKTVGLAPVGSLNDAGELITDEMQSATKLVRSVLEQTLVELAAQVSSDNFKAGQNLTEQGRQIAARLSSDPISGLGVAGIRLDLNTFSIKDQTVSPSVIDSYSTKTNAEQERDQAFSKASEQRTKLLTEAAGRQGAEGLAQMIDDYEDLNAAPGKQAEAEALYASIMAAFKARRLPEAYGSHPITGEAARLISEAEGESGAYLSGILQETQRFKTYIDSEGFKANPDLVKSRLATALIGKLFSDELSEVYVLPPDSNLEIWLNRDPNLVKLLEQERLEEEARRALEAERGN